jgi:hypothetical protein
MNMAAMQEPQAGIAHPPRAETNPLVVAFPRLTPHIAQTTIPDEVMFFTPIDDLDHDPASRTWSPRGQLPMSSAQCAAFLRESALFARQGGRPGVLQTNTLAQTDFYAQTALAIQSELTGASTVDTQREAGIRHQQVLLLASQLEHQLVEQHELHNDIQDGLEAMSRMAGIDQDDDGHVLQALHAVHHSSDLMAGLRRELAEMLPWPTILEAMLFFLPSQALLFTTEPDIPVALRELPLRAGPDDSPVDKEYAGRLANRFQAEIFCAPGWMLLGKSRIPANAPWLETVRAVICAPDHPGHPGHSEHPDRSWEPES